MRPPPVLACGYPHGRPSRELQRRGDRRWPLAVARGVRASRDRDRGCERARGRRRPRGQPAAMYTTSTP